MESDTPPVEEKVLCDHRAFDESIGGVEIESSGGGGGQLARCSDNVVDLTVSVHLFII
jgi:hypothetical protein